jgi:two-component system sensor histidine kinase UhpB
MIRVSAPGAVFVNSRWLAFTGRLLEQALGQGWIESVHPDDRARCTQRLQRAFQGRRDAALEYRLRRADGAWCWLREEASPYYGGDGRFAALVSAAFENGELRQANSALDRHAEAHVADTRRHALRLIDLLESERRRLCLELHDNAGEALTALRLKLSSLAKELQREAPAHGAQAAECVKLSLAAYDVVGHVLGELRPPMLDDFGLAASLRWYAGRFGSETGIEIFARLPEEPPRLPPQAESALFRIAQECLRNVANHASASRVELELEHDGACATLRIEDDGRGLGAGEAGYGGASGRWGMLTMQERACAINARLEVSSKPGRGVRVLVAMRG